MKIIRFEYRKKVCWGVIQAGFVRILKGSIFDKITFTKEKVTLNRVKLLAPAAAGKVILVGLNYIDHAKELNMVVPKEPIIFLKPPTSLIGPGEGIVYPEDVKRLDYEAELAVVIKKKCRDIKPSSVEKNILGYTCLNDVTARDLQKKDGQWTRAKSFDTFCPVGPHIETELKTENLRIKSFLNGGIRQDSSTSNFIFSINQLVSFISKIMTLLPGDIISTGTPPGVGPMAVGDTITVDIEGIGKLENKVIKRRR